MVLVNKPRDKWKMDEVVVENSMESFASRFVLVSVNDIEKLKAHEIKYRTFSDTVRKTKFIRQGKKPKRFNAEDIKIILEELKTTSIRAMARKYNCSTSTIQYIKKGTY